MIFLILILILLGIILQRISAISPIFAPLYGVGLYYYILAFAIMFSIVMIVVATILKYINIF